MIAASIPVSYIMLDSTRIIIRRLAIMPIEPELVILVVEHSRWRMIDEGLLVEDG